MSGFAPFGTQYNRNVLSWIADDYWSPSNQNPNAAYPRLTKNDNNHNTQSSDYWLRNGAFLKLKNAETFRWKNVMWWKECTRRSFQKNYLQGYRKNGRDLKTEIPEKQLLTNGKSMVTYI